MKRASCQLIRGDEKYTIGVEYFSKYSVQVFPEKNFKFSPHAIYDSCVISKDDKVFTLGKCSLYKEKVRRSFSHKLVFIEDLYDFEKLFYYGKLLNLKNYFQNISLLISQKDKIQDSFKKYAADLTYDLQVYSQFFDDLESKYQHEPKHIKSSIEKVILNAEAGKFFAFFDEKLRILEKIIKDFSREENELHGYYFRKQIWPFILCSKFMERINKKPRGYVGDSEMMTYIYQNNFEGKSIFCKLMHKHPIEQKAAQAVRNRRVLIADMIREMAKSQSFTKNGQFRILSVACGPAHELKDIFRKKNEAGKFHVTLMDQDQLALAEAKKNLKKAESRLKTKIKGNFLTDSIRTVISVSNLEEKWGQFHFLYAMGLFDYLTPPVARAVLKKLYRLLSPGGRMVIGNFHVTNPDRYYMEYWMDWVLFYRSEEDMLTLAQDFPEAGKNIIFENTGTQLFLIVQKPEK